MDTLPVELVDRICSFACCDGGLTACSLRSACSLLYAVTERYRFHTVVVTGSQQTSLLRDALRDALGSGRATVRHLFITVNERVDRAATHAALAKDVICLAAPTLETLVCLVESVPSNCPMYYPISSTTSFPRLTHLTFRHPEILTYSKLIARPGTVIQFPKLRYVHVAYACPVSILTAHSVISAITARSGDSLTHLRLSGVALRSAGTGALYNPIVPVLRAMLRLDPALGLPATPPSVWSYVIQPHYTPRLFMCTREEADIRETLDEVVKENEKKGGMRLVLLSPIVHEARWMDKKSVKEWKMEWLMAQASERDALYEYVEGAGRGSCVDSDCCTQCGSRITINGTGDTEHGLDTCESCRA
ncbi:hypothetical protein NEOLEDRAFT_1173742 [Neolentinus lepideus HHB14362 ss-1]|uniref:F-box domain-containing protein n=1 Tax=Neolentinus lepideus HHB14362 ss-1 TaxID=1314782 RepID=A0A165M9P8_9AGAM|nr:hypothetical protein NEOLEDRAFT_1173742 [Neolentinus lepideus HHB14362 ss-1]